ncbi:TIGR04002 family protein [Clostridiaceae bacterium 14S0207]|nr:TIGR04002 family protein [Clostridiaceae bacterium 14S0207]
MSNTSRKTKLLVFTSMFAALIYVTTAFLFHIPTGINGGYIHIGDAFIYLAACILPTPYAMIASAVGAGLSDLLSPGGAVWVIPTIIIKPILVLFFTSKNTRMLCKRNVCAIFLAGIVGVFGYYMASGIMFGNFKVAFAALLMNFIQPIGSGIAFVIFAYALDKVHITKKIHSDIL